MSLGPSDDKEGFGFRYESDDEFDTISPEDLLDDLEDDDAAVEVEISQPAERQPPPAPASIGDLGPPGPGSVRVEQARAKEELFIGRFEDRFALQPGVFHPLEAELYPATPREREHRKQNMSSRVVELMKRHRIFDRRLLERIPLNETSQFRILSRTFFGRRRVKVVVAACALSPLEDFVQRSWTSTKTGPLEVDNLVSSLVTHDDVYYYLGVLATCGFQPEALDTVPSFRNLLLTLVEPGPGTRFEVHLRAGRDADWVRRLFDPETDREKVARTRAKLQQHPEVQIPGGIILLKEYARELGVSEAVMARSVGELCAADPELCHQKTAGEWILKRRMF